MTMLRGAAVRQIGELFAAGSGTTAGLSDGQLLVRFLNDRDPNSFEALVHRHGPMVMAVCRGILRDPHAADDAFQATFLILVKKARSLRNHDALGGWLQRVAHRAAIRLGRKAAQRQAVEVAAGAMIAANPQGSEDWGEWRPILHDEIARLPEKLRLPVVLCDLEGISQPQAAAQLNWSERTLRRRLASARSLLGSRLGRRGIAPTVAPVMILLAREARASLSLSCVPATVKAAMSVAAHGTAAGSAGILANEVLKAMGYRPINITAVALLGLGAATWAGAAFRPQSPREMTAPPSAGPQTSVPQSGATPGVQPADLLTIRGRVLDPDGHPRPGAAIYVAGAAVNPPASGKQTTSGPDGRFEVQLDKNANDLRRRGDPLWRRSVIAATAPSTSPAWAVAGELVEGKDLELRLLLDDAPIRGKVVDPQGQPIAGATIQYLGINDLKPGVADAMLRAGRFDYGQSHSMFGATDWLDPQAGGSKLTTGPDGKFEIHHVGRDRVVCIDIDAPGLEHSQVHALARPLPKDAGPRPPAPQFDQYDGKPYEPPLYPETFEHVVGPSKPIVGVVRAQETGQPLANVTVNAQIVRTRAFANATTDAAGRYRLAGLPKGEAYEIYAAPRPGIPALTARLTVADTEGLKPIEADFALPRGVIVHGRLLNKSTGQPIPYGQVQYIPTPGNIVAGGNGQVDFSQPALDFTLTVPPGAGMIMAEALGTDVVYRRARLAPADRGKGIGGPEDNEISTTVLDAYHAYQFFDIPADAATFEITLEATPGGSRRGQLVDQAGVPVDEAQAYGLRSNWTVLTVFGGQFDALGLEPGRERLVSFSHRGRKLAGSVLIQEEGEPLTVTMVPCGGAIGRLVDEDGIPMPGVELKPAPLGQDGKMLPLNSGFWPEGEKVVTDAAGRFRIEGINPSLGVAISASVPTKPGFYAQTGGKFAKIQTRPGETVDLGDVQVTFEPR